ncbi:MAG: DUF499 domain-containing protein [Acidobacteriota bacterium]|nr:DUF499 domain-containing protein [Acidobacteriota bacterium]
MLKPWREVAKPHKDVLEGTFKQSEFAADLSRVVNGSAPEEYSDPEKFFARTYITEGMRLLLISLVRRLAGRGGDPVIQLQTAFGGGKTHTMLAVYHLACRRVSSASLSGVPPILDQAGITNLPEARVAVIDGIRLSPSHSRKHDGVTVNTLWGELAWQLLGETGYSMVARADQDGTSPGKEILTNLLSKAAPCVVLVDELLAFIRQLEPGKNYCAGTYESNMTFVQALTEAMKAVPSAVLLASLPESDLEAGGPLGRQTLNSLEKIFARVESVWKPVGTEEAFEVVRRRLFENVGEMGERGVICRKFADMYRTHPEHFPAETQANTYYERLRRSYPIHPEIFDRLYEDWSTLDKFQRTRGVLQYMAMVIHRLWNSGNCDALIMPGSLPLSDSNVRDKSIHYLPMGWEPVIEREVDGPRATTTDIDSKHTLFGGVQAARKTARTIFLGSAPAVSSQVIRGLQVERILLGSVQPNQNVGAFVDVLTRLRDRLHYLYVEKDRYWFDTRPNLRREMESRKQGIRMTEVLPALKTGVKRLFGSRNSVFGGYHIFPQSIDVPDDLGTGPRLVVLPPNGTYSRREKEPAFAEAEKILRHRGDQPRQRQNRLIFLAPDGDAISRLKNQAAAWLAWQSIVSDLDQDKLNLDRLQAKQAKQQMEAAEKNLHHMVRETFKWILCPASEVTRGKTTFYWEAAAISTSTSDLTREIENRLHEEEWLITRWAPIHLRNLLYQWYFKDEVVDVGTKKVWEDCCSYLYLPRLQNGQVFLEAVERGVATKDYFGWAADKLDDTYPDFLFGSRSESPTLDTASLLIKREKALAYKENLRKEEEVNTNEGIKPEEIGPDETTPPDQGPRPKPTGVELSFEKKNLFFGTAELDPVNAVLELQKIMQEVALHFNLRPDVEVTIKVDIEAKTKGGFDEATQRTVKENCNSLKFRLAEFD